MSHLYHGSGYQQPELKPGIMHSGVKQEWDQTESNEWLYATTLLEEAIAQGFASVVEKHYKLNRYKSAGNDVMLCFEGPLPHMEDLEKLNVYLYKIDWHKELWTKVDNLHNGMTNEYKTKAIVTASMIDKCEKVDLKTWLSRKKVIITSNRAALRW
ncbi:hypothetical protein D3C78_549130 [compost metagenome]